MKIDVMVARALWASPVCLSMEIVDVAPHLASILTFAVSRHPDDARVWRLHNVETGMSVLRCDDSTKAGCVRKAAEFLKTVSRQKAVAKLQLAARQHGAEIGVTR